MKENKHIGVSLDSFLQEQNMLPKVEEMAACKLFAIQLFERLKTEGISVSEFARRMNTTRAVATRILNPSNTSLTFKTACKASAALGMKLSLTLVDA